MKKTRFRIAWGITGASVALLMFTGPGIFVSSAQTPSPSPSPTGAQTELVRIPFPQDDGSLTPYSFELGYSLMTLIYDTIMWRDPQGTPQPWLASSVEQSADFKMVRVSLREGVKWHDGSPLTSADVAFTFGYIRTHPHPRFTPELRAVESVETPNPTTAVIRLRYPSAGFLDQPLADMPILPAHLWKDLPPGALYPQGLATGSGPYKLVRYLPEDGYSLEANAEYFKGIPAVRRIEVPIIDDAQRTFSAIRGGRADMVPVSLPKEVADQFRTIGPRLARGSNYLGTVLMFNLQRPPFDQADMRRAVANALNVERIAQSIGQTVPATNGYLHPGSTFAPDTTVLTAGREQTPPAGILEGFPIDIVAPNNDPVKIKTGQRVVAALNRAGADARLERLPRDDLAKAVGEDGSTPTFQAAIWGAPPLASYDPDFLRRLFGSDQSEAPFNYGGYRSPAFDQLTDRIATTTDVAGRKEVVAEALDLLATDAPVVPLFFQEGVFAYRPQIYKGWVYIKGTGIFDKQSFFATPSTDPDPRPSVPSSVRPPSQQSDSGSSPFGKIAILFGVAAALIVVVVAIRNRR